MALKNRRTIFQYNTRRGALHRLPAAAKLAAFLPLSAACMALPLPALAAAIVCAVVTAFACGFSAAEQTTDLRPAFFYAALMYILSVFSALLEASALPLPALIRAACIPRADFLYIVLRLTLVIQISALLFRTTTTLEIRAALTAAESAVRRVLSRAPAGGKRISARPRFAEGIALFAGFIPEIFQTWTQIDSAWRARGGKNGLRKIMPLMFALLTLSFERAAKKSAALAARNA